MSDILLQQLQQSANLALRSETLQEGKDHLLQGFALLSNEANQLKSAYSKLQEKSESVNGELEKKIGEVGRLTHLLHTVLRNISEAILFIDLNGVVIMMNEPASILLGKSQEKTLFHPYSDLLPDDFFGFSMKEALKFGISHRLLYKSHPPKEFEISTTFSYHGPKFYHGLMVFVRDVTEKQRIQTIEQRGERIQKLGEMAAMVAHEIRNPLGGIRGYASLLYRDLEGEKHLQEMAKMIVDGTKYLEKLVMTILQYARPLQIYPESADLGAFIRGLIKFVQIDPSFPSKIKIIAHIPNEPFLVPIDKQALQRGLLNLIFNAFEAMPLGGEVSLSLFKQSHCYQISISDTGTGMEDEMLKQLFSPLFTTKQKGNGLGLVETQKIVQAHGGSIDVRSRKNQGSTFTITLPLRRI